MKIVMIVARLNIGGVALNVVQLCAALRAQGADVLLIYGQIEAGEGDMSYLVEAYDLPHQVLPSLGRSLSPLRDARTIFALWRILRAHRPDVVHTHTAKAGFVGRWAAWFARVPVRLHTFHGHVFSGYFSPAKTRVFLWLERLSGLISSRVITLSERLRTELSAHYHVTRPDHITVIPLGIDLSPFANPAPTATAGGLRARYAIPPDVPLIVAGAGRLVPIKNHRLFIAAAARLHAQRSDVRFAIIGDGELRAVLETEIAAHGLAEVVHITGWERDVAAAYADAALVTLTSDNEGTPVALLEALAAGIPVVATDVGGVADVLGAELAAWLVPPRDADALCAAWRRALDASPDVRAARERILATYSIAGSARQHLTLYHRLRHGT
ncbi:MAG: glycosyltransferase family 4 protein [Anaerolineales bacterium]